MKTNLEKYLEYLDVKLNDTVFMKDLADLNIGGIPTLHNQIRQDTLNIDSKKSGKTRYFTKIDVKKLVFDSYVRGEL